MDCIFRLFYSERMRMQEMFRGKAVIGFFALLFAAKQRKEEGYTRPTPISERRIYVHASGTAPS
jgi:hypothetical protein